MNKYPNHTDLVLSDSPSDSCQRELLEVLTTEAIVMPPPREWVNGQHQPFVHPPTLVKKVVFLLGVPRESALREAKARADRAAYESSQARSELEQAFEKISELDKKLASVEASRKVYDETVTNQRSVLWKLEKDMATLRRVLGEKAVAEALNG